MNYVKHENKQNHRDSRLFTLERFKSQEGKIKMIKLKMLKHALKVSSPKPENNSGVIFVII